MKWPLNSNDKDACCVCSRLLSWAPRVPAPTDSADQLDPQLLYLHQPDLGSPPQAICGKCVKEYGT
jgi:hypothetical protein